MLSRANPPRPPTYSLCSPNTTQLTPSTKAGFRNVVVSYIRRTILRGGGGKNWSFLYLGFWDFGIVHGLDAHVRLQGTLSIVNRAQYSWRDSEQVALKKVKCW